MTKFSKIQKAIDTAIILHSGQIRKVERTPFVAHPFSVALILSEYTRDENIIAAGLLHDTLEDVPGYTLENLKKDFGKKIAGIVENVSEDKRLSWQMRKEKYLADLKNGSDDALMVACADKIHNIQSLTREYEVCGEKVWKYFNAPKEKISWFYREALGLIKERINGGLTVELEVSFNRAIEVFNR